MKREMRKRPCHFFSLSTTTVERSTSCNLVTRFMGLVSSFHFIVVGFASSSPTCNNWEKKHEKKLIILLFAVLGEGLPSPNSSCDALFPGRTGHPKGTLKSPGASDLFQRLEGPLACTKSLVPSDTQSLTLTVEEEGLDRSVA